MLGDVAVAVHPEDERYAKLVGRTLKLPLTDREIPVIADDYVDREFGTGAVKITPAHDFNDWQIGARHKLAPITMLTLDAKVNDNAPEKYRGLDRYAARRPCSPILKRRAFWLKRRNTNCKCRSASARMR
jgi:valyl-tRNA synthetase